MLRNNTIFIKSFHKFHTSARINGTPGKVLRKIMGVDQKKRKYYLADDTPPSLPFGNTLSNTSLGIKITGNSRRGNILNKVFMRHITDLMSTGDHSNELVGFGIEINKIKMSPDNKHIRVYWVASESSDSTEVEKILNKNAGHLRHELSTLRVMGEVPPIIFVKDRNYYKIMEVQERLQKADFGEEEESSYEEKLKSEFEMLTMLDFTNKKPKDENTLEDLSLDIPPMPQNVLGLDHEAIFKRVKKGMTVSKAAHRSSEASDWAKWSEFKQSQPINKDPVTCATQQEQRKAFKAFLQQRELLRSKQNKISKQWNPERELIEEEMREKYLQDLKEDIRVEEEDFIYEEVEEHR